MSNPHESGGLSVTLKQEGQTGIWMVFHGSPERIREDMLTAFGLDALAHNEYTLADLVNEVHRLHRGVGNISTLLGGKPVTSNDDPPWDGDKKSEPEDENADPLFALIEAVESVSELQALYKRNVEKFKASADLMGSWKAKGKALKEAGK